MNYAKIQFLAITGVIIAIKAFFLLFSWNNVMPTISELPLINYQQSICLVVVFTCLFQSHRGMLIQMMVANLHNTIIFGNKNNKQPPPNNQGIPTFKGKNSKNETGNKKRFKK